MSTLKNTLLDAFRGDNKKNQLLLILAGIFLLVFFIPFEHPRVEAGIQEGFLLLAEYAREHVLLCLVPAFFIAGAIMVFLNQQSVLRYLGPQAPKLVAYSVASVSGTILAVCSCTVLPLFKGIYKKGAGLGPAAAFLYSGPAINVMAIILTARVLGFQLGLARAVGSIIFAFVIGLCMHFIFRKQDAARQVDPNMFSADDDDGRSAGQMGLLMIAMIGVLVFVNWPPAANGAAGAEAESALFFTLWNTIHTFKYVFTLVFAGLLLFCLVRWFKGYEIQEWGAATRDFAVQILPLLFGGVLIAGFLLGRPGETALIPEEWIAGLVGSNTWSSTLIASIAGAFMYFATLTEVPIMQGLIGAGMAQGPALALLLAGPSLSLPSMLVIAGELGWKKTTAYILLVVFFSSLAGMAYGLLPV